MPGSENLIGFYFDAFKGCSSKERMVKFFEGCLNFAKPEHPIKFLLPGMILFKNRREAGEKLAEKLQAYKNRDDVLVLAVPRGGVAVGAALAKKLGLPLDLIIPRKLPIPQNPEMGFGAITSDGTIFLNHPVVEMYNLQPSEIKEIAKEVLIEVKRREKEYRGSNKFPKVKNKSVIIADDGLATGYTILAAVQAVKKHRPKEIIVAAPVSPEGTDQLIKKEVDRLICLYIQPGFGSFAVASFYQDFHDLTDQEVRDLLKNRVS